MRIRYTPRALNDLGEILKYIDERSPRGARNVKHAIKGTIELIGQLPLIGRPAGVRKTRVLPVRRYPYLIYWSIDAGEAWLVHIRHAARRSWQGD
jgi:toxin ParE1/3/4